MASRRVSSRASCVGCPFSTIDELAVLAVLVVLMVLMRLRGAGAY